MARGFVFFTAFEACSFIFDTSGGAICCKDAATCTDKIKNLCAGLPMAVAKAILAGDDPAAIIKACEDAINAVLGFVMPLCSQVGQGRGVGVHTGGEIGSYTGGFGMVETLRTIQKIMQRIADKAHEL